MNAFLIRTNGNTSEWLETFHEVQLEMNRLAAKGHDSIVTVERFKDSRLVKTIDYKYNGEEWVK